MMTSKTPSNVYSERESLLRAEQGYSSGDGLETAESGLLVLNTNLASRETNFSFARTKTINAKRERERLKWSRLTGARALLDKVAYLETNTNNPSRGKLVEHRTKKCMWVNIAYAVEHWRRAGKDAHFRSVVICGSRCACPVCSEKIWSADRDEIQTALTRISEKGLYTAFVTYTLRHDKFTLCADSLDRLNKASRAVKSGRAWQDIKARYGLVGSITVLENTFSFEGGHHPHKHTVEVLTKPLTDGELSSLETEISDIYLKYLAKVGGSGVDGVAVRLRRADDYVAEYVAKMGHEPKVKKWGASNELTSYALKTKGNEHGHYTMFQLLDLFLDGNNDAGIAWLDYVEAFTGQAMVRWSQGLRELLGMPSKVKSDKDKAASADDESKVFALYPIESWHKVRTRPHDVIEASINMSFDAFREYLKAKGIDAESPVFELIDNGFEYGFGDKI